MHISRTHVTPWNGWLCQMCMVHRSTTTAEHVQRWRRRRSFSFLSFGFLHLVVVASSLLTLSSGSLLLSERMTVLVSFSRQSHTGVLQLLEPFFYWFSVWRRRRRSAWSWRSTVASAGRSSSFFSPGTACNSSWRRNLLLTPSLVGLLLQYTRNPQQTGRKRKRSSTHRRSPATNKVVEILILGTVSSPRPLIWLPSCFAKQQSGHSSLIVWFYFSRKSPQKMKKITSSSKQETENKKIHEPSWSPFDCVTSRVTQQHMYSRRYFQLDLTMSCRESMLQLQLQFPATRGHACFSSRHMQSWTWRQNQSARNLNHFCRAPFRISGHFRWPITPLFFGIFLSFFHSMLSFLYFTSMHGKKLKVLCFKTAIWRTLSDGLSKFSEDFTQFFDFERP